MNPSILTTKLFIPPLRQDLLPRLRIVNKLDESTNYPLTLISASAGAGKTTALSEWSAKSENPIAWISLDENDNDPVQFLTYIIYSLRKIKGNFGQDSLEDLSAGTSESVESNMVAIINEISELPTTAFLVFDDYHTIHNDKVNELVKFFIDHLPPQIHLIFASRVDPPWPLSRYRARNQLIEIRGNDLRLNTDEIINFLIHTTGIKLSPEDAAALEERTEGWVAGLQLAALSMQGRVDVSKFVKDFTGSHLYVAEYLIEEILHQQPESIKSFLLQTSVLERFNPELCQVITEQNDGEEILKGLHRANVFIVPLDDQGHWFRYHHLFADLLKSRLKQSYSKEQIARLHLRASQWFENNNFSNEAIQHAIAARDYEKAAFLVEKHGQRMFFSERYNILRTWLAAIPKEFFHKYPRLEIYQFLIDILEGTVDMYESTLAEKEKLIKALPPSPENDRLRRRALVNLALFYAFQNTDKAIEIAEETLKEIPDDDLHMQAYLYSAFYRSYGMLGILEKASAAYRECFRLAKITEQYEMISNATKIRTYDLCQYGKLDEAADYCQQIIDIGKAQKMKVFYPAGPCYVGLAGVFMERFDLPKAEEYLKIGLDLCHQGAKYGLFTGYVQKIRLLQAKGHYEEALEELHVFEQTFQRREFTFLAQKVALLIAAKDLERTSEMVPYFQKLLGGSNYALNLPLVAKEFFMVCLARIYVTLDELEQVKPLLDKVEPTADSGLRIGRLVEINLLRAITIYLQSNGTNFPEAIPYINKALTLAIDPGYFLLILEYGPVLLPLLQAVIEQKYTSHPVRQHAQRLLQALQQPERISQIASVPTSAQLIEPLTDREMEVLQRIAAGDTNQEIANKLFITIRTVKKHTSNIYGKLNVNNRTQAILYAQEIGLLS